MKKLYRSELSQEIAQIDVNNAWGAKMLKVFTPVHMAWMFLTMIKSTIKVHAYIQQTTYIMY